MMDSLSELTEWWERLGVKVATYEPQHNTQYQFWSFTNQFSTIRDRCFNDELKIKRIFSSKSCFEHQANHLYSIYLDLFHTVMPNVWWSDSRYWAQIKNHWIKSKQRHQEIEAEVSIPSVSVETNIYFGLFGENEIFCMTHEWSDTKHRDNKNRVNKKCDFSSAITRVHNMDFIFELH